MFQYAFMVNAFEAGTLVALTAGTVGWFMVLRRQAFAGHTLAVVGFPGAAAALLLGLPAWVGFFGFCFAAALFVAAASRRRGTAAESRAESAIIGSVQAAALACGFLFVSLYHGNVQGVSALLFGTFLGITRTEVAVLAISSLFVLSAFALVGRRLFFASIDPGVANALGVPVGLLGLIFLAALGLTAAETSQIAGSLLVFSLLVMPAAAAQTVTAHPAWSLLLTLTTGLAITWLGLIVAYYFPFPIGFCVTTLGFGGYLLAQGMRLLFARHPANGPRPRLSAL